MDTRGTGGKHHYSDDSIQSHIYVLPVLNEIMRPWSQSSAAFKKCIHGIVHVDISPRLV